LKENYKLGLVFLLLFSFILPIGLVPLFNLDEGAFSEATREMLLNGDFITTYLNGELRFDKPILIYWLQAFSVSIFGLNEFALRLPSALAGVLWAYSIWWFSRRYFDEKVSFLATFFMVTSLQIGIIVKAAIADSLLNMSIAFAMFNVWLYLDKREPKNLYLAFVFIAIGTLTKGPVAIMIPLVVTFIYLAIKKNLKLFFKMIFNPIGISLFFIIALPWYILEYLDQGMKFIDGFIFKHNLERFDTSLEHHKGSFFYFIPVLILGFLPFTLLLGNLLKNIKEILKNDMFLFLFIWFAFVFLFFSFSGTKLPHYVIYGYTPLFILMAYYFKGIDFKLLSFTLFFLVVLFFVPDLTSFVKIKNQYAKEIIENLKFYFNLDYKISVAIIFSIILAVLFVNISQIKKVIIVGVSFIFLVNFIVLPTYAKLVELPIKEAAFIAKQHNFKVVMYKLNTPSFMVYSQSLVEKRKPKEGDILITKKKGLKNLDYSIIYHKNGIYLVKVEK